MRTKLRPVARASDWPSEVLPTPGGPTRHRIGPFRRLTRCVTARYSTMRSLTFSSPKWSSSRTFWAAAMSWWTLVRVFPRPLDQPVDVIAHDRRFGRHRRHQLQLVELAGRFFARFLRHAGL